MRIYFCVYFKLNCISYYVLPAVALGVELSDLMEMLKKQWEIELLEGEVLRYLLHLLKRKGE